MIVILTLIGCAVALPIRPENNPDTVVGVLVHPIQLDGRSRDQSSPLAYAILFGDSSNPGDAPRASLVEKRDVKEDDDAEDLETAAGTYVLRPLFVYRQQLAYRERIREAIRHGYRF